MSDALGLERVDRAPYALGTGGLAGVVSAFAPVPVDGREPIGVPKLPANIGSIGVDMSVAPGTTSLGLAALIFELADCAANRPPPRTNTLMPL